MKRPLLLAATALWFSSCAINPVSGDRELALITEAQEIAIGQQSAASAEAQLGLVDDAELQDYIQRIGIQLAAASERPELPWTFRVVDDPTPNAFAAPGGYIFFTRGLLALMRNEAELASVLGHEIGHVTARHSVAMISRAQLAQIGLGVGSIISPTVAQFGDLAAAGLQVLFLNYGRDAERQADDLGYRYALAQDYDVAEMVNVFAALQQSATLAGHSPVPTWMTSHPDPGERIARIKKRLATRPERSEPLRIGEKDYMERIDGLIYGANPRNGFFEENRFLHPDLEFQIDLPQDWMVRNLAQAVLAGSPAQDALIQLTIVPGTQREASARFLGQEGLRSGSEAQETVNGLPTVVAAFEAQTEQGTVGGIAGFITYVDRTYQILAYAPSAKMAGHEATFRRSIRSFARLTDSTALTRQPNRLQIVSFARAMTVAQFNDAYPSGIPLAELALINQQTGPEATMPAGFRAKRIVDL